MCCLAASRELFTQERSGVLCGICRGVLPCADCRGSETDLTLYAKQPQEMVKTACKWKETFLGKRNHPALLRQGRRIGLRGMPDIAGPSSAHSRGSRILHGSMTQLSIALSASSHKLKPASVNCDISRAPCNASASEHEAVVRLPVSGFSWGNCAMRISRLDWAQRMVRQRATQES